MLWVYETQRGDASKDPLPQFTPAFIIGNRIKQDSTASTKTVVRSSVFLTGTASVSSKPMEYRGLDKRFPLYYHLKQAFKIKADSLQKQENMGNTKNGANVYNIQNLTHFLSMT